MKPETRIFVALDTANLDEAIKLSSQLLGLIGGVKLGKEFFTANGPEGVKKIINLNMPVFLDLKLHDIPNTVKGALKTVKEINPFMINVHVSGGRKMLEDASKIIKKGGDQRPLLIGVTLLTSINTADLREIGIAGSTTDHVVRLAKLARSAGLDGVVCSANEIISIKKYCGKSFKLIVPGIRPHWAKKNDQKRVMAPFDAIKLGADFIVIGRPITANPDPKNAAIKIIEEINGL